MGNTFTIEGLWAFIQSLSLSESNKQWLISKLQEPAKKQDKVEELPAMTKEELIAKIIESTKEAEEGKTVSAEVFMEELREFIKIA